jgi:hypothetical protein
MTRSWAGAGALLLMCLCAGAAEAQERPHRVWGWEALAWAGYTRVADASPAGWGTEGALGLRLAEVAVWPTQRVRLSAQYDNGLSLDARDLVQGSVHAPTYSVGGLFNWGERYLTRVEAGRRELPGGVGQSILRGEQVVFLTTPMHVKAGGWVGPRADDRTEWVAYVGWGAWLSPRVKVEPVVFLARSGLPEEQESRVLVFGEYVDPAGWQVGLGTAVGEALLTGPVSSATLWDTYLLASTRVRGEQHVRLLLRHFQIRDLNRLTTIAVGVAVGRRP